MATTHEDLDWDVSKTNTTQKSDKSSGPIGAYDPNAKSEPTKSKVVKEEDTEIEYVKKETPKQAPEEEKAKITSAKLEPDNDTDFNTKCKFLITIESDQGYSATVHAELWAKYNEEESLIGNPQNIEPRKTGAKGQFTLFMPDSYVDDLSSKKITKHEPVDYFIKASMKGAKDFTGAIFTFNGKKSSYISNYSNTAQQSPSNNTELIPDGILKGHEKREYFNCSTCAFLNVLKNAAILEADVTVEQLYKWVSVRYSHLKAEDWSLMKSISLTQENGTKVLRHNQKPVNDLITKIASLDSKEGTLIVSGAGSKKYTWNRIQGTVAQTTATISEKLKDGIHVFTGTTIFANGKPTNMNNHHYMVLKSVNTDNHYAYYAVNDPWHPSATTKNQGTPEMLDPNEAKDEGIDVIAHSPKIGGMDVNYHAWIDIQE